VNLDALWRVLADYAGEIIRFAQHSALYSLYVDAANAAVEWQRLTFSRAVISFHVDF